MKNESRNEAFRMTILGARGSMPINGKDFVVYGGATSCFKILAGSEEIYLDAGNGIVNAEVGQKSLSSLMNRR